MRNKFISIGYSMLILMIPYGTYLAFSKTTTTNEIKGFLVTLVTASGFIFIPKIWTNDK